MHGRLVALAAALDTDLEQALAQLTLLFDRVDQRVKKRAQRYIFPCHAACSACCTAAVRFTFLEYVAVIEDLRRQDLLDDFLQKALSLRARPLRSGSDAAHKANQKNAGTETEPSGTESQADPATVQACPVLGDDGLCRAYHARPLVCRLFGMSFNEQGELYACALVTEKFAGKLLRLTRAQPALQEIRSIELTEKIGTFSYFARLLT